MDIVNLLSRLHEAGLTQEEIGKAIGRSQSAVSDMAKGKIGAKRPAHDVVEGLRILVEKYCPRTGRSSASAGRRSSDAKNSP